MVEVKSLKPELLIDYLSFFDREAFTDNPDWAGCYCNFYLANHHAKPWEERTPQENRRDVGLRIQQDQMHGYLAYQDGKVVGWCHAVQLALIPNLYDPEDDLADQCGAIVCFIVAPGKRQQGIATELLNAAVDGFQEQGLDYAIAYPRTDAKKASQNYHGPLSMYLSAGFKIIKEEEGLVVVRRALTK
jgi:ribosomal protein S18 acetylase RimI-like enzyme